jgi:hypothetical protein
MVPMVSFVVLLRAVNVGGTGKLPMSTLKGMCEAIGFQTVRTYIARGTPRRREVDSNPLPFAQSPAFLRILHPLSRPICTPILLPFAPLRNDDLQPSFVTTH